MLVWVKPTDSLVEEVARNMRKEDAEEVWASDHQTPLEALQMSLEVSAYSAVAVVDSGDPIAVAGLRNGDLLTGCGVIWMLGTELSATRYKKEYLIQGKKIIDEALTVYPRLVNRVHSKNKGSIRWLRRMGFTVGDPFPHGPERELFHPFHIERSA